MKTINELLEEMGTPNYPLPAAPSWHVDDMHNCSYGWTDGETWGLCNCEDPAHPWPLRVPGDGPRDCSCFGCHDHEPRWERGKLKGCEYKDHHCDMCHEHKLCSISECGFWKP